MNCNKNFFKNFLKNLLTFPEIVIYYNQKEGRTQDAPKVKNCKAEREDAPKVKNHKEEREDAPKVKNHLKKNL